MGQPTGLSAPLAAYLTSATWESLPGEVADRARIVLQDTVGVMLGAGSNPSVRALRDGLSGGSGSAQATVVGRANRTGADTAALLNATAGHSIELDDSHGPSMTHPAALLVSAALAAAEMAGGTRVNRVLTGLVAGYDVIGRLSKAIGVESQYGRGFFPTSVCGSVAAAACAGVVFELDGRAMERAIALAASQSCGILSYAEDPTHTLKAFQIGVAARNGLQAAVVAATGFGGRVDSLAGRGGLIEALGGDGSDPALLIRQLGERYEVMDTSLKRFACCRQSHAAIDALLDIIRTEQVAFEEITSISVELSHSALRRVAGNPLWTHNIAYLMALASREHNVEPYHFAEQWTSDEALSALATRVTATGSDELQRAWPAAKGAIVTVGTARGKFRREAPRAVGDPLNPISTTALRDKFRRMVELVATTGRATQLDELMAHLDGSLPVAVLTDQIREMAHECAANSRAPSHC